MAGERPTLKLFNKKALGAGPRASNWVQGLDLNQRPSGYETDWFQYREFPKNLTQRGLSTIIFTLLGLRWHRRATGAWELKAKRMYETKAKP